MRIVAFYYLNVVKDKENAKKYYLMGIEAGSTTAMNDLALYYYKENNYDMCKMYLLMAINLGDFTELNNLGNMYKSKNDYANAIKCYVMGLRLGISNCMIEIEKLEEIMHIEIYEEINNQKPNEIIIGLLNKLKKKREIIIYSNKKRSFSELNNVKQCLICFETLLNINLFCGHEVCIKCYPKIKKCPLKCCYEI